MDAPIPLELTPPTSLLLGPGPSQVHPRVLRALSTPLVGHLDPRFLDIMTEVQGMLRAVFRTDNAFTIAVSGTGSAGMEAALVNLVEPGDAVIVVVGCVPEYQASTSHASTSTGTPPSDVTVSSTRRAPRAWQSRPRPSIG